MHVTRKLNNAIRVSLGTKYEFCTKAHSVIQPLLFGSWASMIIEAVVRRCSVKKVFLEILQNSLENTCARDSFLIKLQALGLNEYEET